MGLVAPKLTNSDVEKVAHSLGFELVGFAEYQLLEKESELLQRWLANGYQAGMQYMERNSDKRRDVKEIFPEAKSIVSLGMNYFTEHAHSLPKENNGKLSRYSWGTDYHFVMWEKLDILKNELQKIDRAFDCISYVDTGPVMDKVWAVKAGLGWQGKHTNVINKSLGSWFFIATVITNTNFKASEEITDFCGSCTKCLDACPTGAITEPYVVDANKCISYLTIENKGEIPEGYKHSFDNWLFGCDICQDVCPWNKKYATETELEQFQPREQKSSLNLDEIKQMTNSTFKKRFAGSPILRARLKGLKRNAEYLR